MGGGGSKAPDTSAQEAENARQAELERQRAEEERQREIEYQNRLRAEQEQRLAQERAAQQAEAQRQFQALQQQLQAQAAAQARAAQQAELARQREAERQRQEQARIEAEKAAAAERAQQYSQGRTSRIEDTRKAINEQFAGFDDSFFNQLAQDYVNFYEPQLQEQFREANDQTRFQLSRQGLSNSSEAAEAFVKLNNQLKLSRANVANQARDVADNFRSTIDQRRNNLLTTSLSSANIGPELLPEGVTDVSGQLNTISANLSPFVSQAQKAASGVQKPQFNAQTFGFSSPNSSGGVQGASGTNSGKFNANQLFAPIGSNGGSVRIVA